MRFFWWLLLSTGNAEVEVRRGTPALDCFAGDYLEPSFYIEHLCCDAEQWPPTGWWKCWGGDFTYENCCGEGPSCTDELVAEVWKFLAPKSDRSYRALWSSNTYYGIARVRKESQCQLPFVASRVLALTKMDWTEQWEILHFPRRAIYHSNFQMRSIVDAMWTLIQDVSLEDFLRSGKWAETILSRLYGHSKKTAYYLLSDGMPLLSGRLPVSDAFLSKEDEDFQHLLRRRLNLHLPLPITDAKNYLKRNVTAASGRICASLVIALELPAALQRAEELLRSWVEKNDYGDLFFSHWPVYRLMLYLHRKLSRDSHAEMYSETAKLSQSMQHAWEQSAEMLVISCLPNLALSLPQGWHHRSGCHGPSWRQVLDGYEKVRWVLLISSTMHWSDHHVGSIREGLALAEEAGKMAVGFPTVDRTGTWKWPVRRFEMDGNISVRYLPYPTGYAGSQGRCCRGDTTSGTRAYHWDTLAQLFEEADRFIGRAETMSSLLQRLDFLGQSNSKGYASMTCMVPPLVEDDYAKTRLLHHSDLPDDMQKMIPKSRPSAPVALPISQDLDPAGHGGPRRSELTRPEEVVVLYCGELDLKIESRFVANIFQESLRNCAQILRRAAKRLPRDSWVLFLSPFTVDGVVDMKFVEVLRHALHGQPHALAVGTTMLQGEGESCCVRNITYRFYKLQYRSMTLHAWRFVPWLQARWLAS